MATEAPVQLPPAGERQNNFEQAVAYAINLWPDLNLAVQNNWGGPDSADKRDFLSGAIVDLFPEFTDAPVPEAKKQEDPDLNYVETVLLQYLEDEFEVNIDDDSSVEVAGQIIRARTQCAVGEVDELNSLKERFGNRKGKSVDLLFKKVADEDQDTDWETDDDDEEDDDDSQGGADVNMEDAPQLVRQPKEKPAPEVDEDGFTKVTKKR